jgi:hypothetical protein
MASGKHHGHGATVGVAGDVGSGETKGIHAGSQAVRGGFEPGVEARDAVRFAHVEEIDGVDARVAGQKADVLPPVSCRAYETVEKQKGTSGAGPFVMDLYAAYKDEGLFDVCASSLHCRQYLLA